MNYKETLNYLFEQLPMYQRIGSAAYKADLNNTIAIVNRLKFPYQNYPCIHIGGTNGKGSSSHMLASILMHAGYKVGLYTSPHLLDFRERIKINGKPISKDYVCKFVEKHKAFFTKLKPSFFEMTVGLAFEYFKDRKIDIAIVEVGMGGRLDSTNVINPIISLITNISLDHTTFLGDTPAKIANEKAGIIKQNTPVVIGEFTKETAPVFIAKAKAVSAPIDFADKIWNAKKIKNNKNTNLHLQLKKGRKIIHQKLELDLPGGYQLKNVKGVFTVVELLNEKGFHIDNKHVLCGLKSVINSTGLMGRWQTISSNPKIICDTGHNTAGIHEVLKQIKLTSYNKLHWVFGCVNDKDPSEILKKLPKNASYYFCKSSVPRSMNEFELGALGVKNKLDTSIFPNVVLAVKTAIKQANKKDLVLIGGSTFVVADALAYFKGKQLQKNDSK